jgi:alkylation response protein AidB-like acyl-CoA dehydrogenase
MDFDLSADQMALRDAAAQLLDQDASQERVRAWVGDGVVVGTLPGAGGGERPTSGDLRNGADAARGYDEALWSAMGEQGWTALERPEAEGGLGLSMVEVAVLCEQVGRHSAPAPYLSTVLALEALATGEIGGRHAALVEDLAQGRRIGAVAFVGDASSLSVKQTGEEVVLSGEPDPVVYGPSAEVVVVVTPEAVFGVRLAEGSRPVPQAAMDRTRELGWLRLSDTAAFPLGGEEAATRLINRAATAAAAELLGGAETVLEMAVQYAKDRVQFAKPIGSFQAIKHKLADALVDVEGMRSTVYYAAWCVATNDPEASLAASMAKSWCSDAARRVMATGLQVHGGIGFTWEHPLHVYLKRSQLDQVSFGDGAWHRDRIAAVLQDRVARGASVL